MDHSTRVYDDITEMLPSEENPSPLVRLHRLVPPNGSELWAKLEWLNPFGSVKDRAAWAMVDDLEKRGELGRQQPGRGLVEPTSGNTGISLAALAAVRGYPMRAVVPSKVPEEKKVLLKILGAEVDVVQDALCPLPGSEDGTIGLAKTYAKAQGHKYVMPNQYENRQNVEAHVRTTGPEIWRQTAGRVTHVFTSLGTCGTVTGLATFLKAKNPKVKIIAVQPSPGHDVPGLRNISELDVSKLFDPELIDEIFEVNFELAYSRARDLARSEGLLAGPSSGLIFEGARLVAERTPVPMGVLIFCDNVFKYTSNMLKHLPELAVES
jgi:S-sulfo-L-cysteine synthase (O-acetyl-L-serine-dependent)